MPYTPKGLVTVAFLKTQLDAGRDHLSLFEPLVIDALNQVKTLDLTADEIRGLVFANTNLKIPVPTIQTLLGRCAKEGYLIRSGGRFHKTAKAIPFSNTASAILEVKAEQDFLGQALLEHSRETGITFDSPESAVQALADFISEHKLEILLQHSPVEPGQDSLKKTRNLARFITERCIPEPSLNKPLKSLLEGILLADVLLMRDVQSAGMKFTNCRVYLDTRILIAALGLDGQADELATKEGLAAIRNAGAQLLAFERTVTEIRGILRVYEDKLATNEGRLSLFPTSMTAHMIGERYSPTEVKIIALEVEQRLRRIGIAIHAFPTHVAEFTLDETALSRLLSKGNESGIGIEPRVKHDVDCAAAILTLRAGRVAFDLERCDVVFSTASGLLVKNVQQWYADQKCEGISPVVHHSFLTTLAWLKKPSYSPDLKLHELAAVCLSAIRPTEAAWEKMISTLRQYVAEGRMSTDESVAIVANGLTETLLSKLDDDFEPDSRSINEAIERVREALRLEHLKAAQLEIDRVRAETQDQVEAARLREEAASHAKVLAEESALAALESANAARGKADDFSGDVARLCGATTKWVIICLIFGGAILSGANISRSGHPIAWSLLTGVFGIGTILSLFGSAWGTSAVSIGARVESFVAKHLRRKLG
jgi:hypothetical protein